MKKIALVLFVLALVATFFAFDLGQYLSLGYLKSSREQFQLLYAEQPVLTMGIYFLSYVLVTALSLPGAVIMTLAGGALFGLGVGFVLISFASSIGATLAFLVARFLLRDGIRRRFANRVRAIDTGVKRDGAFYLFALRLVPVFPFFIINLVMGLTAMRTGVFYIVSQVGMLPGTLVYVNAGTQIGQIESLGGLLSPALIGSFFLLGVFPLVARKILDGVKARRVYRGWVKPKRYDRNLIVIGAGAAGLVTAYIAAAVKARVTLIEKNRMGGDCLNTGCVPSKALIKTAKVASLAPRAQSLGIARLDVELDFAQVMERVQRVVQTVEPHDSVERYTELGVECLEGEARLISPWEVEVNGERISARHIVLATGARPFIPPIRGLEGAPWYSSDTIWSLRVQPRRLVVLGGGPIGSELTQAFARLGSQVTQVEMGSRILAREDVDVSHAVTERFRADGISVQVNTRAEEVRQVDGEWRLQCKVGDASTEFAFDALLIAVGRQARLDGFGLKELGVRCDRVIETDEFLRTNFPNIYAVGDVAGPFQFTHTAAHQAWYAAVNSLFGQFRKFRADYSVIPWCTFTDPEVARVGLSESEAETQGIAYEVTRYGLDDLDRAIADEDAYGFVKVLTVPGKDRILGVTIVGEHAGDLIAEYVLAMKHGLGLNKILGTIHIYPTLAEANKYAAGEWKKAHAPQTILKGLSKYHAWRRG